MNSVSTVGVCNMALGHCGVTAVIADLDERSNEARVCKRFYDQSLRETLEAFPWPFATKFIELALVEEDPNTDWRFSYRYPQECVKIRKILTPWGRQDIGADPIAQWSPLGATVNAGAEPHRIPYTLGVDDSGKLIYTDQEDALVEITAWVDNPVLFDAIFIAAVSRKLAAYAAVPLTGGDPHKLADKNEKMHMMEINKASVAAMNEVQKDVDPEAESIRARR